MGDLVAALGDGVLDLPAPQEPSGAGVRVRLVSQEPELWSFPPSARNCTRVASIGLSPDWPAVSNASTGVQVRSDRAWTLVLNPPR